MVTSRPQQSAARTVRERLLDAAEELFYARGIASTGVDAVIEHAGVATGSLYKNFGGKDALVAAYLQARDERWRDHWEACVAEQSDPDERVLAIFTALARWDPLSPVNRGCAHLAATIQLPVDHPAAHVALAHKMHVAERLGELCVATDSEEPGQLGADMFLIYEGATNLLALGSERDPVDRARRLAQRCLASST